MLLGDAAMQKLKDSRVAVFGLGGVGGHAVEALARSGVGALDLIDNDKISVTNINRQILATDETVGRYKTDVAAERIAAINPDCKVTAYKLFYLPSEENAVDFSLFDYVVDAIDTVSGKLAIIKNAKAAGVPVISCMGTGNKLFPSELKIADIYSTSVCPLAKVMRRELRKAGVESLKAVYSEEEPKLYADCEDKSAISEEKPKAGSVAFVPAVAGLMMAGEVIKDLIAQAGKS